MGKFIDRQKLEAHFSPAITGKEAYTVGEVLLSIQKFPSADVVPVVHAHWIETEDLSGNHYAECSNCCLLWWIDGESSQEAEMNYCPRCGAKMDEEVEDA